MSPVHTSSTDLLLQHVTTLPINYYFKSARTLFLRVSEHKTTNQTRGSFHCCCHSNRAQKTELKIEGGASALPGNGFVVVVMAGKGEESEEKEEEHWTWLTDNDIQSATSTHQRNTWPRNWPTTELDRTRGCHHMTKPGVLIGHRWHWRHDRGVKPET